MGDFTEHFDHKDFECRCGCGWNIIDMSLVLDLERWRAAYGKPMIVNSDCRCEKHNAETPGSAKTSSHLSGHAIDIHCVDPHERWLMLIILGHLIVTLRVRIDQLELCPSWLHVGNDITKGQQIAYYGK